MEAPVLEIRHLTKTFGDRIAVNNISFSVKKGEIFGFLGPNGAGKTTTMKVICGLSKATQGEVFICGISVRKNFEKAIAHVGAIIENPLMYGYLSGYDNLKYYASLYKGINKNKIIECAKIVGLENRLKDKVSTYSLGMRQRLGICQALLHDPKLLVLDEPLSGLDPAGVKEMRDFLRHLAHKKNIAILISSHMLGEMEMLCDTYGIINNGHLLEVKTISQLQAGIEGSKKIKIAVDYPNFAGKIIVNEFQYKVEVAGNNVLISAPKAAISKITSRLISYNISIFGIDFVSKSLEQLFLEIIDKRNKGKSGII